MEVLILSLVFPPDNVSTAQIMGDLAVDLQKKGHQVTVITTKPHYNRSIENEKIQPLSKKWWKILESSRYHGITVYHSFMPQKGKSFLFRITAWFFFHFMSMIVGLTIIPRPAIIIAPSPPLTIGLCAWLLSRWYSVPFIYNVQEIYPDIAIRLGAIRNAWLISLLYRLEKFIYSQSSQVTVIASRMRDQILKKGLCRDKVSVIPNFVDVGDLIPLSKDNEFSRMHGVSQKFTVSYAGNMGPAQGLEHFLESARILKDNDKISFMLMGGGVLSESLQNQIERCQLNNVLFLPYQPYSLMNQAYAASDVCLVPQARETGFEAVPSKVYRIMACARPVLAVTDENSDLAQLIRDSSCGALVEPGSAQSLADMILHAYNNQREWQEKGACGRKHVVRHYTRETVTHQYHNLIEDLCSNNVLVK